jgi:hypothetical protein
VVHLGLLLCFRQSSYYFENQLLIQLPNSPPAGGVSHFQEADTLRRSRPANRPAGNWLFRAGKERPSYGVSRRLDGVSGSGWA